MSIGWAIVTNLFSVFVGFWAAAMMSAGKMADERAAWDRELLAMEKNMQDWKTAYIEQFNFKGE